MSHQQNCFPVNKSYINYDNGDNKDNNSNNDGSGNNDDDNVNEHSAMITIIDNKDSCSNHHEIYDDKDNNDDNSDNNGDLAMNAQIIR